jgi:hypothetical protein
MKRASILLACLLSAVLAVPAQAHGFGHGGGAHGSYRSGHHGGYGYRGDWGRNWVAPVLGAAIVGGAIYAASTPGYAMPPVVVQQQYAPPNRVAYFCPTSQQYYPNVPTCHVPWQPVTY